MIDAAKIIVEGGRGGDGSASFRHEKYVPKGGPDGGDGGKGGDVVGVATREINTLSDFHRLTRYQANHGQRGGKKKMHGRNANDLAIRVPIGTIIKKSDGHVIADLTQDNEKIVLARGGNGGRGNCHFATATHQIPHEFEPGGLGEKYHFNLELKLLADIGLIGLPNSGKSTLLSVITKASPKIANYPFTTTEPNLGVTTYKKRIFVVADIPGLIKGAARGKGLGDRFLKHIERTKILVHLVKASNNLLSDYQTVRDELKNYNPALLKKKEIVVVSHADEVDQATIKKLTTKLRKIDPSALAISAITKTGLDELLDRIIRLLPEDG
jgi:GTP-binding protein